MPPFPVAPTLEREEAAWSGAHLLVGVDEVGRGPLAGPVVAAAVVFPAGISPIPGVRDSKTLSAGQRSALVPALRASALVVSIGAASVREIDRLNIRVATALAMHRAVARLFSRPSALPPFRLLLDGLPMPELGFRHQALIDGDAHCYSIAAAGVIAKTVRDRLMHSLDLRYPGYGWSTNAGYGTAEHCAALARLGPTRHHRLNFSPVAQLRLAF
jgi:ribonuclease HII